MAVGVRGYYYAQFNMKYDVHKQTNKHAKRRESSSSAGVRGSQTGSKEKRAYPLAPPIRGFRYKNHSYPTGGMRVASFISLSLLVI